MPELFEASSRSLTGSQEAAATLSNTKRRPVVVVLGMHRSGTSLCAHVLSALGIDMADQLGEGGPPRVDNPRGHWERWEIVGSHDSILELLNREYFGAAHDFGLPVAWWADPAVGQVRREIVAFLRQRMGNGYFGFKDPRAVRLLPLWLQIANELNLELKFVLCLRNPAQVARSLQARDGLDPEIGEARWFAYVADFFRYSRGAEFCLIEYETWFTDVATNLDKLCRFLDLEWQYSEFELSQTISGIVDADLRHDDALNRAAQPIVRSLYQLVRRADRDSAARDDIRTLVAQFVGFQQLHGGIQRKFEQIAETAARVPVLEREAATLRQALADRDAALAASRAELVALREVLAKAG